MISVGSRAAHVLSSTRMGAALFGAALISTIHNPAWAGDDAITRIVQTAAQARVDNGQTVGVAVGVITGDGSTHVYSFGLADVSQGRRFTDRSIFQIGSVTKVFTTNLLGQAVNDGTLQLDEPLSDYATQLGQLAPLTAQITLKELADFTGGFPDLIPSCDVPNAPLGCPPDSRPDIQTYTAGDFAVFFRNTVPMNEQVSPPIPVSTLPAPYFYSDISIGLLGLLIGAPTDEPLNNDALTGWKNVLQTELLDPLGMSDTMLYEPTSPPPGTNIAQGYYRAIATPVVGNGQVTGFTITAGGTYPNGAPAVTIVGGNGNGATAKAVLTNETVTSIEVVDPGQNYLPPPVVSIAPPTGAGGTSAGAEAVIANGQVIGANISDAGSGYTAPPAVTIEGGHTSNGSDATAVAYIANGAVRYIAITNGGAGYVPPVAALIDPSPVPTINVPIWAPAGALKSTLHDMLRFAHAALGDSNDEAVTAGFKVAETPFACSVPNYSVAQCPTGNNLSALAWAIDPADTASGTPAVTFKNGGLPGFSTEVMLMPERHLAVVVFVNTNDESTDTGEKLAEAGKISSDILHGLYYEAGQ